MHYFVYVTTNLINGRCYIGKHETENLDDGYLGSGIYLARAVKKYGKKAFRREIIYMAYDRESLAEAEISLISQYDAVSDLSFYGHGGDTYSGTSEWQKQSRIPKFHNANRGKSKTPEHRKAISIAKKGIKRNWSDEVSARYIDNLKKSFDTGNREMPLGNRGNQDFRHTDETKRKLSENLVSRRAEKGDDYVSVEGKRIAKKKRAEYWTEEARQIHAEKIRAAHRNKKG